MKTRYFEDSDLPVLNRWLKRNGHPELTSEQVGWRGFVVPGVAMGFLLTVDDMPYGIFEGVATNTHASSQTRNKALNAIYSRILDEAKQLGISHVIAFSNIPTIIDRLQRHGFTPTDHTLLIHKGN